MRAAHLLLLSFVLHSAHAEDRFYQIIDASGRVQIVKQSDAASSGAAAEKKPLSTSGPEKKSVEAYAPFDGDAYVDSEDMDQAHQKGADSSRKHFYLISDGLGQRLESMDGAGGAEAVQDKPGAISNKISLRDSYSEHAVSLVSGLSDGCLAADVLAKAPLLNADASRDVVFDRRLQAYLKKNEVVQVYELGGSGLRGITVRSHALKDNAPAFVMPLIAFANSRGCVTRVGEGYFQHYQPSSVSRHAMLEGSLVVRPEDAFFVIIMPDAVRQVADIRPEFRVTSLGRVSIKWQK